MSRKSGEAHLPTEPQNDGFVCRSPFYVAYEWCTGTAIYSFSDPSTPQFTEAAPDVAPTPCQDGASVLTGTYEMRRAGILWEPLAIEKIPPPDPTQPSLDIWEFSEGPWLPPFVTAYHDTFTVDLPDSGACEPLKIESSLEEQRRANLAPANTSEYEGIADPYANIPYCGVLQRRTFWYGPNADCATAQKQIGYNPDVPDQFKTTGALVSEYDLTQGKGCVIVEPRKLQATCSNPLATCNAGWRCADGGALPRVRKIAPIDLAEAVKFQ